MLLGATGTGKSATTAWLIERLQRPTLVMAPNKTLAAQLANEFRELLPNNAVEYFVTYYDYYQPEAYVPQTDTYIEKDSSINDEVERLRHSATMSLLTRRDVDRGRDRVVHLRPGHPAGVRRPLRSGCRSARRSSATSSCAAWSTIQYTRNDLSFTRGTFRVRGDTVEIFPVYEELAVRIEMFGDEIERLYYLHPLTGEVVREVDEVFVFPAIALRGRPGADGAGDPAASRPELAERLAELERQGKLLEAQRLRMRTTYDIEMMRQVGFCSGIENYSRHIDGRAAGQPAALPARLLPGRLPARHRRVARDRAADRRHVRGRHVPQADAGRARLPAAVGDGQPAAAASRSSSSGSARRSTCRRRRGRTSWAAAGGEFVEQVIRPTGLVDPEVVVKPTKGQIDDLCTRSGERAERDERVLVTTLTKKMAEDLTDYLLELGIRVRYLHSEVDTLRRVELLRELRQGEFDVLVGINLLREGLDLPEVSLVSILDADKEGFLRSARR